MAASAEQPKSFDSELVQLRLLSKSEPATILCLPWLCCQSLYFCSWQLKKDRAGEGWKFLNLPKLQLSDKNSHCQGFSSGIFTSGLKWKPSPFAGTRQQLLSLQVLIPYTLPTRSKVNRNEDKHRAPCPTSILSSLSHWLRLSFAHFCCSWYRAMNSHRSLYWMKMTQQTSTWQRWPTCYWVPKLD